MSSMQSVVLGSLLKNKSKDADVRKGIAKALNGYLSICEDVQQYKQ
jgi:hypothetical protein